MSDCAVSGVKQKTPMPLQAGLVESFKSVLLNSNVSPQFVLNNSVAELNRLLERRALGLKHVFLPVNAETCEIVDPKIFRKKKALNPIVGMLKGATLSAEQYAKATERLKENKEVSIKTMIESRMEDYDHRYNDDVNFPNLTKVSEVLIEDLAAKNGCSCISLLNEVMAFFLVYYSCSKEKLDDKGKYKMQLHLKDTNGKYTPVNYF